MKLDQSYFEIFRLEEVLETRVLFCTPLSIYFLLMSFLKISSNALGNLERTFEESMNAEQTITTIDKVCNNHQIALRQYFLNLNQAMSFLYTMFNLIAPVLLLMHRTLIKQRDQIKEIQYGKWILMLVAIVFFNLYFTFFDYHWFPVIFDLLIKFGIIFLPENINEKIEGIISKQHLQVYVQKVRCKLLEKYIVLHSKITEYSLQKMNTAEQISFKEAIVRKLNCKENEFVNTLAGSIKNYEQTGISCNILTTQNVNPNVIPAATVKQNQQKYKPQKQFDELKVTSMKNTASALKYQGKNLKEYQLDDSISLNKNKQSNEVLLDEIQEAQHQRNKKKTPIDQRKKDNLQSNVNTKYIVQGQDEFALKRRNTDTVHHKNRKEPNSQLKQQHPLQKLDLSISEYSDMFEEDQINDETEESLLICKVEAIVQLNSLTTHHTRMQIYNLQLYSNGMLRIVSLLGRQFEKHKLVSMNRVLNGYYELNFAAGSITKRKVKFRGQYQQFMKYLRS